jgi:soluble lytic murein transglycosylase-like protein
MAQIKPFEGNVQFQSSAQGGKFDPGTIPNPNAGLAAKLGTINESFDNMRQSGVANIDARSKEIQELSRFSETLGKTMMEAHGAYLKNEQEQADLLFAEDAYGQQKAIEELNTQEQQLKALDDAHENTAAEAIKQGAPVEIVERLKQLSGARGYYYRRNAAKYAGENFQTWLQDKFLNDTREYEVEGITRPINSTEWAPQHKAFIMKKLLGEYYKESGLDQVSRGLQAKYALPQIGEAQSKMMGVFRKEYGIQQSTVRRDDLDANFTVDFDLSSYLKGLSTTYDDRGAVIGFAGSWQHALKHMQSMFDAGMMSEQQLQAVEKQIDPQTGKRFIDRWPTKFRLLRETLAAENRKNFSDEEAAIEMQFKQEEKALLEFFSQNNVTQADVEAAENDLFKKYGKTSDALSKLKSNYTVEALDLKRINEQFENLAEQGLLTPEMVMRTPLKVQEKWLPVAERQKKALDQSGNFKTQLKAIEGIVKQAPEVKVSPDGTTGLATLVIGELQSKFMRKVTEYMATGEMNASQAATQAMAEVNAEFSQGIKTVGNRYYVDKGTFVNILPKNATATARGLTSKINNIRWTLQASGRSGLESPNLIFDQSELKQIEKGYGKAGWSMPAEAQYWANQLNVSPFTIINSQRKALGMKELPLPGAVEATKGRISPELQALLNRYPSPNRSTRALSSMRAYVPETIPNGYGKVIQKAAQANGIDPAILAGLLDVESGFNPRSISSAGARGIAQIVPKWHPGVNPDDPIASINYAAKWLSETQRQFGGDMRLALLAYNGGTPTISKYRGPIPGSRENQQYYGKVIKAASKYGYGQAWDDPATMRGKFVSSITFDSGQPGIDVFFEDKKFTSVLPGRVKEVSNQTNAQGGGYGNYVVVESIDPLTNRPVDVLYAHLNSVNVREGQRLTSGTVIGQQGGTGRVRSADGTIASIDFFAPRPKGSKDMTPYSGYQQLRSHIAKQLRKG